MSSKPSGQSEMISEVKGAGPLARVGRLRIDFSDESPDQPIERFFEGPNMDLFFLAAQIIKD
jgi:hypothetical protein